jgi:hypothetical protein
VAAPFAAATCAVAALAAQPPVWPRVKQGPRGVVNFEAKEEGGRGAEARYKPQLQEDEPGHVVRVPEDARTLGT